MRSVALLFLLSAALVSSGAHQDDTCRAASGSMGLSTPVIDLTNARCTFRVFSDDVRMQSACSAWNADFFVNDQIKVSLELCSCDTTSDHSVSCNVPLNTSDFSQVEISVEVFLSRRKSDACTTDATWIRARNAVLLQSKMAPGSESADSAIDALAEGQGFAIRGAAQMDAICSNLSVARTFDGQQLPDPSMPVLVAAADSLLPYSVTGVLDLLHSMAEHAPGRHLVLCDIGSYDLMEQLQARTSVAVRKHVSVIEPPWGYVSHFSRVLAYRSACLAAVFCVHQTAMWVDSDLSLQGGIDDSIHQLSRSGLWLINNAPRAAATSAFQADVSVATFGFSRSGADEGAAFQSVFLPFFGQTLAELDAYTVLWNGAAWNGEAHEQRKVALDRRERTVAGALERRTLGTSVRVARQSGLRIQVRECVQEHPAERRRRGDSEPEVRRGLGGCAQGSGTGREEEASLGELMLVSRTDKIYTHAYDRYYERRLDAMRHKRGVRVLELGGADGRSLDVWLHYFSAPAAIHVLTLEPVRAGKQGSKEWACMLHAERCGAVEFFIGDQGDEEMMELVLRQGARLEPGGPFPRAGDSFWAAVGGYDVIIDDASHYPPLQIFSLGRCFIIEDLETSYWNAKPTTHIYGRYLHGAGVGEDAPGNAVAKLKELVEVLFRWHMGLERPPGLTVLGAEADSHLFSLAFGAGLAILDRATLEQEIHSPRVGIARRPWMHTLVDAAAIARWADQARETNPY